MEKTIQALLEQSDVTLDELLSAINRAGGRDPERPILYSETCQVPTCGNLFFSVTQDHFMRINNGYPTHCPKCREGIRRNKKAELKRNKYSHKK